MNGRSWARLILAMAPLLSGCKGFWDVPSGSGGGGTGTASGIFYVANQKSAQLAGMSFAAGSTTPAAIASSPFSLGAAPFSVAISPNGGFLYVSTAAGIYVYSINTSTGALSILNSGGVISADPAFTMTVDSTGGWLIESVSGLSTVNAIPLNPTTGVLLSGGTEQVATLPAGATLVQQVTSSGSNAANNYVFVAMGTAGIATIPFNASASGNPFSAGKVISPKNTSVGSDITIAVDRSNGVLYVGETNAVSGSNPGGIRMFTIGANATLTEVTGSPFASGGIGPSAILPTANYVYVANKAISGAGGGNIVAFAITTTAGTPSSLTAVTSGTISAGTGTIGLAEDSTGTYILAINSGGSPDLNAYTITSTGALKAYGSGSTGSDPTQPVAIAAQ